MKDLRPDEIKIVDNNLAINRAVSLRPASELPQRIGVLIDVSNSMKNNQFFRAAVEESEAFIYRMLSSDIDEVMVGSFFSRMDATHFMTKEEFTKFHITLRAGGGTAVYDAIFFSCRERMRRTPQWSQRMLVVLSDGTDNSSWATYQEAIAAAQVLGVTVYWVDTSGTQLSNVAARNMREITEETGGRFFRPTKLKEVAGAFNTIAAELPSRYVMAYSPENTGDKNGFHSVRLAAGRKNVHLRASRGYFDAGTPLQCKRCDDESPPAAANTH